MSRPNARKDSVGTTLLGCTTAILFGLSVSACTQSTPDAETAAQSEQATAGAQMQEARHTQASGGDIVRASFTADGEVLRPVDWRSWVYVGTPLTPNALNGGEAPFPEFHNVYVEPSAFEAFSKTGKWPNGTQIAKELVLVREGDNCFEENGSCAEVSGVGYFQGEFHGLELTVKDTERWPDEPGGWVYYSFGHQAEPYADMASAFPTASCNSCHEASADTDFVFTQFYPVLRAEMAALEGSGE